MMKYKDGENEDGAIPSLLETFFLILATPLAFHIKAVLIPMVDKIPAGSKKKTMLDTGEFFWKPFQTPVSTHASINNRENELNFV